MFKAKLVSKNPFHDFWSYELKYENSVNVSYEENLLDGKNQMKNGNAEAHCKEAESVDKSVLQLPPEGSEVLVEATCVQSSNQFYGHILDIDSTSFDLMIIKMNKTKKRETVSLKNIGTFILILNNLK